MITDGYPRVLLVGAVPFSRSSGTGLTLSNLFHGWPRDRLAQIYTTETEPSTDVCDTYFRFDLRNIPLEYAARRLVGWDGRSPAGEVRAVAAARNAAALGSSMGGLTVQARAFFDLSPAPVPPALHRWTAAFRPEVVYSLLGSVRVMRLALRVARHHRVPLVPHFMDDWPATLYTGREVGGLARVVLRRHLREVIRAAPLGMGISGAMAREYEARYGIPFAASANCVDDAAFADPAAGASADPRRPLALVYTGGLHLGRWRSLRDIAVALEETGRHGTPARLTIHAPVEDVARHRDAFAGLSRVVLGPPLASDEVPAVLRAADVLVHVESFAERFRRYTRFSLSTKIPQYLAAGRPILGYGPAELASMDHLTASGGGVVVATQGVAALTRCLRRLLPDSRLRAALARDGHAYAQRHHRRDTAAAAFAAVLRAAVPGPDGRVVAAPPVGAAGARTTETSR